MNKIITIVLILSSSLIFSQKMEKIKGDKNVITTEITLDSITSIELFKDIKLNLVQADENKLVIYADKNLHDIVDVDQNDGILSLSLLYKIASKKEFDLTLHMKNLEEIILNSNSEIITADYFEPEAINVVLHDKSKAHLMLKADVIIFESSDKAKAVVTFNANSINYSISGSSKVSGKSDGDIQKYAVVDKSNVNLVGKTNQLIIISSEIAKVKLANLIAKETEITAGGKSDVYTKTTENLSITSKENAKIYIYGNTMVDLIEFKGNSTLYKKE